MKCKEDIGTIKIYIISKKSNTQISGLGEKALERILAGGSTRISLSAFTIGGALILTFAKYIE